MAALRMFSCVLCLGALLTSYFSEAVQVERTPMLMDVDSRRNDELERRDERVKVVDGDDDDCSDERTRRIRTGKLFSFPISAGDEGPHYTNSTALPPWLVQEGDRLLGVPSNEDIGEHRIRLVDRSSNQERRRCVRVQIRRSEEPFTCSGQRMATGHVLLDTARKQPTGLDRVALLRRFFDEFISGMVPSASEHDVRLETHDTHARDDLERMTLLKTGPVDGDPTADLVFSWRVKCGASLSDIAGDRTIGRIESLLQQGGQLDTGAAWQPFVRVVNYLIGDHRGSNRIRRAVPARVVGTPVLGGAGATPTVNVQPSIVGTPVASPTPVVLRPTKSAAPPATTPPPPITTKLPTTTTEPTTVKEVVVVLPPKTLPPNVPPTIAHPLGRVELEVYKPKRLCRPKGVYTDANGDLLTYTLKRFDEGRGKWRKLTQDDVSWIGLDDGALCLCFLTQSAGLHDNAYAIEVFDGLERVYDVFTVNVKAAPAFTTTFSATIGANVDMACSKVHLAEKIATASNLTRMRVADIEQTADGAKVTWSSPELNDTCTHSRSVFKNYRELIEGDAFRAKMGDVMSTESNVVALSREEKEACNKEPTIVDTSSLGLIKLEVFEPLYRCWAKQAYRDDDGDILTYTLKKWDDGRAKWRKLTRSDQSWIGISKKSENERESNCLCFLPSTAGLYENTYAVEVSDGTEKVHDQFTVEVKAVPAFTTNFSATVDTKAESACDKVRLAAKILTASQGSDDMQTHMRVIATVITGDSMTVTWSSSELNDSCSHNDITFQNYKANLEGDAFSTKMRNQHSLRVTDVKAHIADSVSCDDGPVKTAPIADDGGKLKIIIIVVVVIVLFALILALVIYCCCCRGKRAYAPQQDDTLAHKKPVIFLEEFEEKPDFVSLQPLVLPNEKPANGTARDSPETAPYSSSGSTESDNERAALVPQTPKTSGKAGSAPPPYSAH